MKAKFNRDFLLRRRALPILAGAGFLLAILLVASKRGPEHNPAEVRVTPVTVVEARRIPLRARAVGYGEVKPTTFLEANAEVSGRVVYISPELKQGAIVPHGTVVVRIDDTSYRLALAQARADLVANQANLKQLAVDKRNNESSLSIAQRSLAIGEKELSRKKKLLATGSVSRSEADSEEQNVLRLRQDVQTLESQLSLIPTQQEVIEAQIAHAQAQVRDSEYNLERTEIQLPYDARIGDVFTEAGQFVSANARLFDANSLAQVEVAAELPLMHIRPLLSSLSVADGISEGFEQLPSALLELEAELSLVDGAIDSRWQGRVVRLRGSLDATSRTMGVVVAVDNSYQQAIAGKRPPLLRGMYTKVVLLARPAPAMVIPRHALHEGKVYVAEKNKLSIRPVSIDFHQGNLSVIRDGLTEGEKIIVTDVVPALEAMPLTVTQDNTLQASITQEAFGSSNEQKDERDEQGESP